MELWLPGTEGWKEWDCCFLGTEFQICKIKISRHLLLNYVSLVNNTQLPNLKRIKMVHFISCVFCHNLKKKKKECECRDVSGGELDLSSVFTAHLYISVEGIDLNNL